MKQWILDIIGDLVGTGEGRARGPYNIQEMISDMGDEGGEGMSTKKKEGTTREA
jgi:hypothetical protein